MTEERLRELHKKYLEDPTDKWAKYRYRLECVRMGRLEEAGLEVGDEVLRNGSRTILMPRRCGLGDEPPIAHEFRYQVKYGNPDWTDCTHARDCTLLSPAIPSES